MGTSLKESKRKERMIDTGRPSCFGEQDLIALFLKRTFISFSEMMLCTFIFWPWRPVKHFKTLLIKAVQPENLFSLEMFFLIFLIYSVSESIKQVTFLMEQRCSELQERTN